MKKPVTARVTGFSIPVDPLFDPLCVGNTVDIVFHSGRTVTSHLVRYMTVHIQRKAGCGMAQILLHHLDAVPALDGGNGKTMAEVVEANIRLSNGIQCRFAMLTDSYRGKMASKFISEYQTRFFPCSSRLLPHSVLPLALLL